MKEIVKELMTEFGAAQSGEMASAAAEKANGKLGDRVFSPGKFAELWTK